MVSVRLRYALLIVVMAAGTVLVPLTASPAHAAVGDLTCTAVFQIDFSPALRGSQTSQATIALGLSNCLSLNGKYSRLRAATATGSGTATAVGVVPCSLVLTIKQLQISVTWSTGEQSTISASVNDDPYKGQLGFNGMVTSGPPYQDSVFAIGPFVPNLDCAVRGLTSIVGTNQKVFS